MVESFGVNQKVSTEPTQHQSGVVSNDYSSTEPTQHQSLHQAYAANQVTHTVVRVAQGEAQTVGSDVDGQTALGKLRYAFGRSRDGYAEVMVRDQSVVRDLSAALTSVAENGELAPSVGSRLQGHNAGYAFDLQIPLGSHADGPAKTTALYRHLTSYATQSVQGPASGISTSYFNDRDRIEDNTLELARAFGKTSLELKYGLRTEGLDTFDPSLACNTKEQSHYVRPLLAASGTGNGEAAAALATTVHGLTQTQRSIALRLVYDPSEQLHYIVAAYDSTFSIFGRSFDPRLGIVWTPSARTAIRASAGTTFQSPQLTALYVPSTLPAPDANGHISIGNAHLQADHATEYDLGFEELLAGKRHPARLSADFYRTNLRTPSQRLLPAATCPPGEPNLACASIQSTSETRCIAVPNSDSSVRLTAEPRCGLGMASIAHIRSTRLRRCKTARSWRTSSFLAFRCTS